MRVFLNAGYSNVWSFDLYGRTGGGVTPEGSTGYRLGKSRPVHVETGAFSFFTDSGRALYKYDGEKIYPVGLYEPEWITNHSISAGVCLEYPRVARCPFTVWTVVAGLPVVTIDANDITWMDDNYAGTGTTELIGLVLWVAGFPFKVTSETFVSGTTYKLNLGVFNTRDTFYFPYASYSSWDDDLLHVVHSISSLVFTPTPGASYDMCDFLYDFRAVDGTAEDYPVQKGVLKGKYEYAITLVTKHGYESNISASAEIEADENVIKITIEDNAHRLNYGGSYIKYCRLYRSLADSPGVLYRLADIPFESNEESRGNWFSTVDAKSIFIDNIPDEELKYAFKEYKLSPEFADSLAATKNTLGVADGSGVFVSQVGDPETFYNYIPFESQVIAIAAIPFFDYFIVFLRNKIYTLDIYNSTQQSISSNIGLIGKNAFVVLNDRIVFMAPGGMIYQFAGGRVVPLTGIDKIRDVLLGRSTKRKLNRVAFNDSYMFHVAKYNQIWAVLGEGSGRSNIVFVHELDTPIYTIYKFPWNIQSADAFENAGEQAVMLVTEYGHTLVLTPQSTTDYGEPVQFMLESPEFNAVDDQFRFRRFYAEVMSRQDIDLTMVGQYDREGYIPEAVLHHTANERGDERFTNLLSVVVPTYQFKITEEGATRFVLKQMVLLLQPKGERTRSYR